MLGVTHVSKGLGSCRPDVSPQTSSSIILISPPQPHFSARLQRGSIFLERPHKEIGADWSRAEGAEKAEEEQMEQMEQMRQRNLPQCFKDTDTDTDTDYLQLQ